MQVFDQDNNGRITMAEWKVIDHVCSWLNASFNRDGVTQTPALW
jgi:hypothetical protein